MVDESSGRRVAVGVDGTDEAVEAARYAAAVASERGWDLVVVHAYPSPGADAELSGGAAQVRSCAESLVADVVGGLDVAEGTQVQVVVTPSSPVTALREASGSVSLLVLGHHHFDLVGQRLVGRTSTEVVAEARCPVAVVPPGWSHTDRPRLPVVVALEVASPAEPALRCAFEEAERRGTGLVTVHAVPVDGQGSVFTDEFFPGERVSLGVILARAGQDHPGVGVRSLLVYGNDPASRLVCESTTAALVVVGRPRPDRPIASWSRSVVRAVMARSCCPLLVAPPEEQPTHDLAPASSRVSASAG